jgi:glycerol-3-phosphate O-acyltransferase
MTAFPPDPTLPLPVEPELPPEAQGRPIVVLADVTSTLERRIVNAWLGRVAPGERPDVIDLAPSRRRRAGQRTDPRLPARLRRGDDPWVIPVRIAWFPTERDGRRSASWIDVLKLGDPRDPDVLRQHVILARDPSRLRIVVGPGASAAGLIEAHQASVEVLSLVDFVTRRAHLALERGEREIRGNRYKVPRFVHEEILGQAEFRDGVMRIAGERGMAPEIAFARSRYYLREIAATHSPFVIDLIANAIHWLYRQGYGAIVYDRDRVREIAELGQRHPIAFLPSHRSNLDRLSLQYLLWENDLPPNHTAAGINMNFFPVGPLIRRTGAFFIRRSFKDNDLYKFVLRSYLDYLVERRFPLEWYLEGGRSRTGKLLPPRYGMLGWVADAVRRNRADDLYLVPTSIAYDQIFDVADYAVEARGGEKPRESIGYVIERIRTLRRRYGNIHVRFAEPISIGKEIDVDTDGEVSLDLQKLAFEVMYRIASVTPVTPTAIVSIALLAGPATGSTVAEVHARCLELVACVDRRRLPTTEPLRLDEPARVKAVMNRLADHGSVTIAGDRCSLTPEQAIQAAYYRNMVVHFFVPGAIAEVALAGGVTDASGFWERVGTVRDLLKFEFFFPTREEFRHQVDEAMREVAVDWEQAISRPGGSERLLAGTRPIRAPWSLLPILEAYRIVAEELVDTPGTVEEKPFLDACLVRGRHQEEAGMVPTEESVSLALFTPALSLARNRGLVDDGDDVASDRAAFAREVLAARDAALSLRDLDRSRTVTPV